LALAGHDEPKVCLDTIISAMKDTAKNMHENYKETSMGGIAVSLG
jgi:L-serine dehydratase